MSSVAHCLGLAVATALSFGLAACATLPAGASGEAVDAAYGIPPGSVPAQEMRPDGLMINGLLPLPPNSGS